MNIWVITKKSSTHLSFRKLKPIFSVTLAPTITQYSAEPQPLENKNNLKS